MKEEKKLRKYERPTPIPRRHADEQMQILLDYYDVDRDFIIDSMKDPLDNCIMGMLKSITRGRLTVVDKEGGPHIVQKLEKPVPGMETITYRPPGSKLAVALKNVSKDESRLLGALGALSGNAPDEFDELDHTDRQTAEDVGNYFLFV
jgi:hypothetical protein